MTGTSSADRVASAASLLDELGTLHLATVTPSGVPQASCAPYVTHGGAFYVYLSALASHVGNLRAGAGVGVLLVRDEAPATAPEFVIAMAKTPPEAPAAQNALSILRQSLGRE